jgi:hypothetical protein
VDALACHHLARYFGCVTLPLHAAGVHGAKLNALFCEVLAEKTRLFEAKLGKHVVVVPRSSLRVTNQVDVAQSVPPQKPEARGQRSDEGLKIAN